MPKTERPAHLHGSAVKWNNLAFGHDHLCLLTIKGGWNKHIPNSETPSKRGDESKPPCKTARFFTLKNLM